MGCLILFPHPKLSDHGLIVLLKECYEDEDEDEDKDEKKNIDYFWNR
ncbi:hypothetical protein OROGR_020429 [Orobanche gracilis]